MNSLHETARKVGFEVCRTFDIPLIATKTVFEFDQRLYAFEVYREMWFLTRVKGTFAPCQIFTSFDARQFSVKDDIKGLAYLGHLCRSESPIFVSPLMRIKSDQSQHLVPKDENPAERQGGYQFYYRGPIRREACDIFTGLGLALVIIGLKIVLQRTGKQQTANLSRDINCLKA